MKTMVSLSGYLANMHSVGNWGGQEKLVASNVNRLYRAVYNAAPEDMDEYALQNILWDVWLEWGSDDRLLSLTEEQIEAYVATIF